MDRRRFLLASGAVLLGGRAAWAAPAPPMPRRLRLIHADTGETFEGPYRTQEGVIESALKDLSTFLRDRRANREMPVDVAVLDFLADVMAATGQSRATLLSGYRTPETNAKLAKTRFGVAEQSQHMYGRAIDIYLPARLADAAAAARKMQRGGVGWYPASKFIHLDSGPVRSWTMEDRGLRGLLAERPKLPDGTRAPLKVNDRIALQKKLAKEQLAKEKAAAAPAAKPTRQKIAQKRQQSAG